MDGEKASSNQPYLTILSKVSSQISWLTFSVLIITSTNTFLVYQHHFGELAAYKEFIELAKAAGNYEPSETNASPSLNNVSINIDTTSPSTATPIPTSTPTATPNVTANSSPTKKIKNHDAFLDELERRTSVITLPILGIPLTRRDFVILNFIIGAVFLLWLYTLLNYTKNFLENLLNEYHYPSDADANIIQSMFFLIMPAEYTSKGYKYYEWVFHFFLTSLVLLILSDLYDIYWVVLTDGTTYATSPYTRGMLPHFIVSGIIITLCLASSIYLFRYLKSVLNHIRNTLILLRWSRIAFFPVLYEFAKEKKNQLEEEKNILEYRVCDDSNSSKLLAILKHENEKTNEIKAAVNLPESVREFYKRHPQTKIEYDEKLERNLTIEESFMRDYFRAILREKIYEPELYNESSKI